MISVVFWTISFPNEYFTMCGQITAPEVEITILLPDCILYTNVTPVNTM